jgi:hypothetical protein
MRPDHQNNQNKRTGGVTQAVEHQPSKHEALGLTPSTAKNVPLEAGNFLNFLKISTPKNVLFNILCGKMEHIHGILWSTDMLMGLSFELNYSFFPCNTIFT